MKADFQREDDLAAATGIFNGLVLVGAFWLMVLCAWIYQRFF